MPRQGGASLARGGAIRDNTVKGAAGGYSGYSGYSVPIDPILLARAVPVITSPALDKCSLQVIILIDQVISACLHVCMCLTATLLSFDEKHLGSLIVIVRLESAKDQPRGLSR